MLKEFKKAFTLAEVLIVIGIIGVVAALTLPNLNHATGDKETVTRVKKIYSALTDAFDRAEVIYGSFEGWNKDLSCSSEDVNDCSERAAKRITEFMKVSKDCAFEGGCLDDSEDYLDNGYSVMLSDGMALEFLSRGLSDLHIAVDVNGPNKGKNLYGRDIFEFGYFNKNLSPDNNGNSLSFDGTYEEYDEESNTTTKQALFYNTIWVIQNGNMDYLKVDDEGKCPDGQELNWTTNTTCN